MSIEGTFGRFDKLRSIVTDDSGDERANVIVHNLRDFCMSGGDASILHNMVSSKNWDPSFVDGNSTGVAHASSLSHWLPLVYIVSLGNQLKSNGPSNKLKDIVEALNTSGKKAGDGNLWEETQQPENKHFFAGIRETIMGCVNIFSKEGEITLNTGSWVSVDRITLKTKGCMNEYFETANNLLESIGDWKNSYKKALGKDAPGTNDKLNVKDLSSMVDDKWTYKPCKSLIRRLLENIPRYSNKPLSDVLKTDDESLPKYRKDNRGQFVDQHGNVIGMSVDDSKCCEPLGLNSSKNNSECIDYMVKCLDGSDIQSCKKYMEDDSFWANSREDAKKIHPGLIETTLKQFKVGINKEGSRNVVEPIENWVERMSSKSDIKISEKLIHWLSVLRTIYNENPALGNVQNSRAFRTQFSSWGMKPKFTTTHDVSGTEATLATVGLTGLPGIFITNNNSQLFTKNQKGGVHQGSIDSINNSLGSVSHLLPGETSRIVENVWRILNEKLNGMGKTIAPKDMAGIKSLLTDLKQSEEKLHKSAKIADRYIDILSLGAVDKENSVNIDHLKDFVDKNVKDRAKKLEEKVNNLSSIFVMLSKTISQQGGSLIVPPYKYFNDQ